MGRSELRPRGQSRSRELWDTVTRTFSRVMPPSTPGWVKFCAFLGLLSFVLSAALAVWLIIPRAGQLRIELRTEDGKSFERAEIFVDGHKECDVAPCTVANVSPGWRTIKVVAPGFSAPADAGARVRFWSLSTAVVTLRPATARVHAESSQRGVRLFVDGQDKGTLPITHELAPGPHTLRFDGGPAYQLLERDVVVSAGDRVELGKIELKQVSTSAPALRVTSAQEGVKLFVDGKDQGTLPVSLDDLAPGPHKLRFLADDHYEPAERAVDLVAGEVVEIAAPLLKVLKGRIKIELSDPHVAVTLIRTEMPPITKHLRGPFPMSVDVEPAHWKVVATKPGFEDFVEDLSFPDGNAEAAVHIELAPRRGPHTKATSPPG